MSSDANNFGCPPCPNTQRHTRQPGVPECPRSDTYRMIESGNAFSIFGWLFRCRTCDVRFFRASREAALAGWKEGAADRAAKAEQQRMRR